MQACYLFTIILRMSTAVNRKNIKRKRGEEGVGGGVFGRAHNRSWKTDSENRGRQSMQNGT